MDDPLENLHLDLSNAAHLAECEPIEFLRRYAPRLAAISVASSDYPEGEPYWLYGDVMALLEKEQD